MQSPLAPNDLFSIVTVADPQLARDGIVYFRRAQLDRAADATLSTIWRVAAGRVTPFTAGRSDRLPRVAPDGATLAFVGEREEKPRIYLIPTAGGEARAIGNAYEKIVALAWSPDGTRLAFVASTEHEPATARVFHDAPSGARHIRALPFKTDMDGLLDGTRRSFRFRPDWIARSATRSSATCARDSRLPRPFGALTIARFSCKSATKGRAGSARSRATDVRSGPSPPASVTSLRSHITRVRLHSPSARRRFPAISR